jgi:hypothetical protein
MKTKFITRYVLLLLVLAGLLYLSSNRPKLSPTKAASMAATRPQPTPTDSISITGYLGKFCLETSTNIACGEPNILVNVRGERPCFTNSTKNEHSEGCIITLRIFVDKAPEKGYWEYDLQPGQSFTPLGFNYKNTSHGLYNVKIGFVDHRSQQHWSGAIKIKQY